MLKQFQKVPKIKLWKRWAGKQKPKIVVPLLKNRYKIFVNFSDCDKNLNPKYCCSITTYWKTLLKLTPIQHTDMFPNIVPIYII